MKSNRLAVHAAMCATMMTFPGMARAADGAAQGGGAQLEEVVVTAQKRAEKLQDVPVAVTALSANDLEKTGIDSGVELGKVAADLNFTTAAGLIQPFLRGIGNDASTIGNESSTAAYIDDVYVSRIDFGTLELPNIDRVEVLAGPQGTLFGRNASGGLIAVYTKNPTQDLAIDGTLGYGNYDTLTAKLYVAGGITDNLAADFSALHINQGDGWGRNFATHNKWGYGDVDSFRSKWIWDISDDTSLRVIGSYDHGKTDFDYGNHTPGTVSGSQAFYTLPPFNMPQQLFRPAGFYDTNEDLDNVFIDENTSIQARLDSDFGFAKFSSISSFRNGYERLIQDGDATPLPALNYILVTRDRTATQEFQLASEDSPFDWIVGAYYLNAYGGYEPVHIFGQGVGPVILGNALGICPGCAVNLYGQQRVEDYATYGQATFHVLPDTNLTLGARYTIDDVIGRGSTDAVFGDGTTVTFPGTARRQAHFYKPTFKVALDHHFTDDIMGYISFSRGFKAGTFNTLPLSGAAARPEVLDAYEIGEKSTFLDRRLQVNASAFYYQITDPQVQEIVNGLVFIGNAGAAEIKGVDLDTQYLVTEDLRARFGAEFLDAHYTSFPNAPFILPNFNPPYGTLPTASGNAAGNDLVRAPRFSFNAGFNYDLPTEFGDFNMDVNYSWKSGYKFDPDGVISQRSFGLLDASVTYMLPDDNQWEFRLWGKNLTQQKWISEDEEVEGPQGYNYGPGAPTTYGVSIRFRYDDNHKPAA